KSLGVHACGIPREGRCPVGLAGPERGVNARLALDALADAMKGAVRTVSGGVTIALTLMIRAYQSLHVAFFRGSCRFHPTCSHYALDALELHGPLRGSLLTAGRILRCQPFCRGGFDPVPEPKRKAPDSSAHVVHA